MMKKKFLLLLFTIGLLQVTVAQVRFGIRGGINDIREDASPLTIINQIGEEVAEVGLNNTKLGLVGGLILQAQFGIFVVQPELLLSSNTYEYQVVDLSSPNLESELAEERFRYFDIPLLLGFKFGPLRLQAGPEAHIYVSSTSDLIDLDFYRESIDDFTFGWLGNVGLDIWNLMIDLRYEGNLTELGNSFVIGDQEFRFDERPARWVFSVGFLF